MKHQEGGCSVLVPRVIVIILALILLASCKQSSTPNPAPSPDAPPSTLTQQSDELAVITVDPAGVHRYPHGIRGLNNEFQKGVLEFTDQDVVDWVKPLHMGWIRWPGGTNSNFFNWKIGYTDLSYLAQIYTNDEQYVKFSDFSKEQRATQVPERLSDFKSFLQQVGARTVIPINGMMDSVDQVYDLAKFVKDNHVPVMYWELDNEPFFFQDNPKEFANTDDYLAKMKPYNDAIKAVLPDAKTLISYHSTSTAPWNNAIAKYPHPYWDGINFHRYKNSGNTLEQSIRTANDAIADSRKMIDRDYLPRMADKSAPIFIAEYGVQIHNQLGETAYHGIYNAESLLRSLQQPNVRGLGGFRLFNGYLSVRDNHAQEALELYEQGKTADATAWNYGFYYGAPAVFTGVMDMAVNASSTWLDTTVNGGGTVHITGGTLDAVYAQGFRGDYGNKNYLVIVNKSDTPKQVKVVWGGAELSGAVTRVFAAAPANGSGKADPKATNRAVDPDKIREKTEQVQADSLSLPGYSVTRLEWSPAKAQPDLPPQASWLTDANVIREGAVLLRWLAADGADSYRVLYGTSADALNSHVDNIDAADTELTVDGLAAGRHYYFRVEAVGKDGSTASDNVVEAVMEAPESPVMRRAYNESAGTAGVEWQSVSGANGYKVRYRADGGAFGQPLDAGNAAGLLVGGLASGQTYEFQVCAYNGYGDSDWSQAATALILDHEVFAPNNVLAGKKTDTSVQLTWTPSLTDVYRGYFENEADAAGWTVLAGDGYKVVDGSSASRKTHMFESSGDGTQLIVRGEADWDNYDVEARIQTDRYAKIGAVGLVGRVQDADNYYALMYNEQTSSVQLIKMADGSPKVLAEKTLKSLSDAGNRLNTRNMQLTLSIQGSTLRAMSGIDELLKATDGTYKTGKVGLLAKQTSRFDEVTVAMSSTRGGSYSLYRSTEPDSGYSRLAEGIQATSYTDDTCVPGTTYYYKLQGVDRDGNVSNGFSNIAPK